MNSMKYPMTTKITVTDHYMCATCADIVLQGYSDAIDCDDEHQKQCNKIDGMLVRGHYWMASAATIRDDWSTKCEGCGVLGVSHKCQSAVNS